VQYTHGLIRELMTNYGKIDVLWYDVRWPLNAEQWKRDESNGVQPAIRQSSSITVTVCQAIFLRQNSGSKPPRVPARGDLHDA
jgi:hypothetical protein